MKIFAGRPFFFATLSHLFFAFFLFSPFFLEGKILVGSTDNYFGTWVNYLFTRDTLAKGDPGIWNPNILGGIDFTASPHNHLLCPLDWPLFLLPRDHFLQGLTIQIFLLVFLIGPFAYLFFREELGSPKWAYLASLLYQLGGFTFFSITTYSNTQLYLLGIITPYLIWTADRRRPIHCYGLWTVCLALIIVAGNPMYSFAMFLLVLVLFLYRYWPGALTIWRPEPLIWAFYGAACSAVLLTAVRWLPVAYALLLAGTRPATLGIGVEWGRTFLGVGAFVPEAFGISLRESESYLRALGAAGHAQFHGFPFYGTAAAFLVLLALVLKVRQARFWLWFLLINTAWLLNCPPISAILDFLFYPAVHTIIPKEMITIAFCAVAAHTGMYLEHNWERLTPKSGWLIFATMAIVAAIVATVWAFPHSVALALGDPNSPDRAAHSVRVYGSKLLYLGGAGGLLAAGYFLIRNTAWRTWALAALLAAAPAGLAILYRSSRHLGLFDNVLYRTSFAFLAIALLLALVFALLLWAGERGWISRRSILCGCLGLVLAAACLSLWPSLAMGEFLPHPHLTRTAILGLIKFVAFGVSFFLLIMALARRPGLRPIFFPCLCTLLLIDLLPYNKNFSRQVTEPFQRWENLFPDRSALVEGDCRADGAGPNLLANSFAERMHIDTANYRVNHAHMALKLTGNEIYANLPSVYGVRSYGGVNSDSPAGLMDLLHKFNSATRSRPIGVAALETQPVLLDLLGCGYDLDDTGGLVERPTALSRFMLFHRCEVQPDHMEVLTRLVAKSFVARDHLILEEDPGIQLAADGPAARPLAYTRVRTSELNVTCETPAPALLFFGDTWHSDWQGYVDGQRQRILRADYDFMAVPVPAGRCTVVFRFQPRMFYAALPISGAAVAGFLATLWLARFRRRRTAVARRTLPADLVEASELRPAA